MATRLADAASTFLGMILAVTPVTFWIAWTPAVFSIALAVALASAALLVLLHGLSAPEADRPATQGAPRLSDEFVGEVHKLFPLTYHHSRRPAARFRRAMAKLSRLRPAG